MASQLSVATGAVTPSGPAGESVSLRAVRKAFGDRDVLRGIDLEIAPGEFVAVVGRSGCGKSTLLRLLAGLDAPSGGEVFVGDAPVQGLPPAVRLMFQDARLLPWKRVGENVALGLPPGPQTTRTVEAALAQVGLVDRVKDWPVILSGGSASVSPLARALASTPRLLLLDEPLGALDALTRREMQDLIARLWADRGFTAVLVTHDVEEAIALADRVLVLDQGLPVLDLRVDLPRPRLRGTADFAGLSERLLRAILGE